MGSGGSKFQTNPDQLKAYFDRKFVPNYLLDPDRVGDDEYALAMREAYEFANQQTTLDPNYQRVMPAVKLDNGRFARKQRFIVFSHVRNNTWYYRDRLNVPRGPCVPRVLREAWESGHIDENTIVWGKGMTQWLPIRNVRALDQHIRAPQGGYDQVNATMRNWWKQKVNLSTIW